MYIITVQKKGTILYTVYGGTDKRKAKSILADKLRLEAEISNGTVSDNFVFVGKEIHKTLSIHKLID